MKRIRLGRTNLYVSKTAFGALPIQRVSFQEADQILKRAYEAGINFFDTANMYRDSEEKIGRSLSKVREDIILATKSMGKDKATLLKHINQSLKHLRTDYVDLFQFHNPSELPSQEMYQAVLAEKKKGKIRHIGITNHRIGLAFDAIQTGLYEALQFPFSLLSGEKEIQLVKECEKTETGFIAMKGMAGGLLTDARAAFGFMSQFENVVPIYGIQKLGELEEFIQWEANPPAFDDDLKQRIETSKAGLSEDFCRGCGYCLPCPSNIDIPMSARITLMMTRSPAKPYLSDEWKEKMERIHDCIQCGLCKNRCPYELDTPNLLKRELKRYHTLVEKLG